MVSVRIALVEAFMVSTTRDRGNEVRTAPPPKRSGRIAASRRRRRMSETVEQVPAAVQTRDGKWLCIDAPDEAAALVLVQGMAGFHAEIAPGSGVRCEVWVELEHDRDRRLADALRVVESWLVRAKVSVAPVRLDGRSYLLEGQAA
jgi:hypothetical protein